MEGTEAAQPAEEQTPTENPSTAAQEVVDEVHEEQAANTEAPVEDAPQPTGTVEDASATDQPGGTDKNDEEV